MSTKTSASSLYTHNAADRLKTVTQGTNSYSYVYNGAGDRLQQTVNGATTTYTLDLTADLTQVLGDGTNTYLYGYERIAQNSTAAGKQYFLNDALGSVRRLTNAGGAPTLTRSYEPYGKVSSSSGAGSTAYGFAGEWTDNTGLIHLRARYYASGVGRFVQRDPWRGDVYRPGTLNGWNYTLSNPINYTDPSGREPILPILVCLGLVVADGPAPIGDAVCAALLAGTAEVATFSLTVAMNPPTQYTGIQYSNFTLEQPSFPLLIFPLPEPQPSRPLVFPLPQQRLNRPLIFPLPVEGQLPCNTSPFPLRSGLNLPPYTPPFELSADYDLLPYWLSNPTGRRPPWRSGEKDALIARDGPYCVYCGKRFAPNELQIEHIEPWFIIKGRATNRQEEIELYHDPDNLALACRSCNASKQARTLLLWLAWKMFHRDK